MNAEDAMQCIDVARILCRRVGSVRPSVCLIIRLPHVAAAGLLLWARRAGDVDRQRRPPGAQQQHGAQLHGAQQQMRAVSRCQLS